MIAALVKHLGNGAPTWDGPEDGAIGLKPLAAFKTQLALRAAQLPGGGPEAELYPLAKKAFTRSLEFWLNPP